jgi:hypothetical protein
MKQSWSTVRFCSCTPVEGQKRSKKIIIGTNRSHRQNSHPEGTERLMGNPVGGAI